MFFIIIIIIIVTRKVNILISNSYNYIASFIITLFLLVSISYSCSRLFIIIVVYTNGKLVI